MTCNVARILLTATALWAAGGATAASAAGKALIIGIDKYPYTSQLEGAAQDALSMRDFAIQRWGFAPNEVKTLIDGQATRSAILDAFDRWLVDGTKPGDSVLFFFSGHGYHVPDLDGDEGRLNPGDDQDETLVAYDGRLYADGRYDGMVIDDDIAARLKKLSGRRVTMLFDSCFSGTMTRSAGGSVGADFVKTPDFKIAEPASRSASQAEAALRGFQRIQPDMTDGADGVVAFFAAASTELAQVNQEIVPKHGVFTEAFLRGAAGAADADRNGVVSVAEIDAFVRAAAAAYCRRNFCRTKMTPFVEAPAAMMHKDILTLAKAPTLALAAADALGPGSADDPVTVTAMPAGPLKIGGEFSISVTSPIDGALVVIDLPPDDDVKLLFPNEWSVKAGVSYKVKAGQTIRFPDRYHGFSIKAEPPAGRGTVLALAIADDIPFPRLQNMLRSAADPTATRGGLAPVADPWRFLGELGKALIVPWTEGLTTRGVKWAMGRYDYEIVK